MLLLRALMRNETDWEKSMESLLLVMLVAAVAVGFLSEFGVSLQSVWTSVVVRMQAALVQTHVT